MTFLGFLVDFFDLTEPFHVRKMGRVRLEVDTWPQDDRNQDTSFMVTSPSQPDVEPRDYPEPERPGLRSSI